jgi:hypothetical protein
MPHRSMTVPAKMKEGSAEDRRRLLALGVDLQSVWEAPTTTARDRKELLRTLLEEVIITVRGTTRRTPLSRC